MFPDTVAMPATEAEWLKIKAPVFAVDLHASETQTKIMLVARQRVAILPDPADRWYCAWDLADPTPTD